MTQQAVDHAGALRIAIVAPSDYCVDPARLMDMRTYDGEARITNTGAKPVMVTYAVGNTAFRAFHSVAVWQPSNAAEVIRYTSPPLAPADIQYSTTTLEPGQSLTLHSWSRHQDAIERAVLDDTSQASHTFTVEYAYQFQADGRVINGSRQTTVIARLGDGGQ